MSADATFRNPFYDRFTVVPNELLESGALSAKAVGLMCYLLSRPTGWEPRLDHLATVFSDGKTAMRTARRELIDAGWLVETREHDHSGQLRTVTTLAIPSASDIRTTEMRKPDPGPDQRKHGKPAGQTGSGFPDVGEPVPKQTRNVANTERAMSPTGAGAPTPQTLIASWIDNCNHRPPDKVINLTGARVKGLLNEGFDPPVIEAALEGMRVRGLHPSTLDSLVNEILNSGPTPNGGGGRTMLTPREQAKARNDHRVNSFLDQLRDTEHGPSPNGWTRTAGGVIG